MPRPYIITLLEREYGVYNDDALREAVAPSLHHREVILDFKGVRYVDSTALSVLIGYRKLRAGMGFPPKRFINVSTAVRLILRLSQLDKVWPVFDSLDEALASF